MKNADRFKLGMLICGLFLACMSILAGSFTSRNANNAEGGERFAFSGPVQPERKQEPEPCKCEGVTPCSCGDNCQCVKTNEPPKHDNRLVVTIYNAKDFYCGACEVLKSNLHQIPDVQFVVHSGPDPWWIEAYPTLHWTGEDGEEYQLASGDINLVRAKLRQHNPSLFPVQKQTSQVEYYYQPTRKGRRFFSGGCAGGRCR